MLHLLSICALFVLAILAGAAILNMKDGYPQAVLFLALIVCSLLTFWAIVTH
jgi:hypothetical protein